MTLVKPELPRKRLHRGQVAFAMEKGGVLDMPLVRRRAIRGKRVAVFRSWWVHIQKPLQDNPAFFFSVGHHSSLNLCIS